MNNMKTMTSGIRLLKLETITQININQTIQYFVHQYQIIVHAPTF